VPKVRHWVESSASEEIGGYDGLRKNDIGRSFGFGGMRRAQMMETITMTAMTAMARRWRWCRPGGEGRAAASSSMADMTLRVNPRPRESNDNRGLIPDARGR
jgi:hypothetical protein